MLQKPEKILLLKLIFVIISIIFILCNNYNPFQDYSNACTEIKDQSFRDGDTVSIFSTETISIAIMVPGLVDSVRVTAPGNRFFTNGKMRFDSVYSWKENGLIKLNFSYAEAGTKNIEIATFRRNGREITQTENLVVKNCLSQKDLTFNLGSEIHLSTKPVSDPDAIYMWDFNDTIISSKKPDTLVNVYNANATGTGALYVMVGKTVSSRVPFRFSTVDTIPPVIRIVNDGTLSNDTIITGSVEFSLRAIITDNSNNILFAKVDNDSFDFVRGSEYRKILYNLDTLKSPKLITIEASDQSPKPQISKVYVFVKYDPSKSKSASFHNTILIPAENDSVCITNTRTLLGRIDRYTRDTASVKVKVFVNDVLRGSLDVLRDSLSETESQWNLPVTLIEKSNQIRVITSKGSESYTDSFRLYYDPKLVDNIKPVIIDMSIDDFGDNYYISKQKVTLKVIADDNAMVSLVTCNGDSLKKQSAIIWKDSVLLEHRLDGNKLNVVVSDGKYTTSRTETYYYNHLPRFRFTKEFPKPMKAGQHYKAYFMVEDLDNDAVQVTYGSGDTSFHFLSNDTSFQYFYNDSCELTPQKSDTITIRLNDQYQQPLFTFTTEVDTAIGKVDSVSFENLLERFPAFLEVAKDTLKVCIRPLKGTPDFLYNAKINETGVPIKINKDTLIWIPSENDTGKTLHLSIVVTDKHFTVDSLNPVVKIVPRNRPLFLRCENDTDTLSSGAIDLRDTAKSSRLSFAISDPDDNLTENFTAYITLKNIIDTIPLNKERKFTVNLFSSMQQFGSDTLWVTASDRAGHLAYYKRAIDYGPQPFFPRGLLPRNGSFIESDTIHFSWAGNKNRTGVWYEFYLGFSNEPMVLKLKTTDTTFAIKDLKRSGTYFWQVKASNGKEIVSDSLRSFNYRSPEQVTFITSPGDFKSQYEVTKDTIRVALRVNIPNNLVTYTARFKSRTDTLRIINSELFCLPTVKDTGRQQIIVIATDTNSNKDTLLADITIVPVANIDLLIESKNLTGTVLDLSSSLKKDTLYCTVNPGDSLSDGTYSVTIVEHYVTRTFSLSSGREFQVVVDPVQIGIASDSITISVTGGVGATEKKTITVLYNNAVVGRASEPVEVQANGLTLLPQ